MPARRIIPCLDVKNGRVVKGVQFRNHRDMGDIVEHAARYRDEGADELVFYDITASAEQRSLDLDWVRRVAMQIDVPFAVAGGLRSVDAAVACLDNGADKISINSPALERPELISEIAERVGAQCVVVGVDSIKTPDGAYYVKQYTGDPDKMIDAGRATMDWVIEAQERGAGEIVLNCMDQDGVRNGYNLEHVGAVRAAVSIPVIASGGAGAPEHFRDVFQQCDASGALAATVFHAGTIPIPALKEYLDQCGIEVRR